MAQNIEWKKNKIGWLIGGLAILACGVAVLGLRKYSYYRPAMALPTIIENISEMDINDGLKIVLHDGIWSSRDDDFYPVDNDAVDLFVKNIHAASLAVEKCPSDYSGTDEIVLQTDKGEKVKLLFERDNEQTKQIFAVSQQKCEMLIGTFKIPSQPYQWFSQPLLPFSNSDIEEIYGADPQQFAFSELFFYQATQSNDFADWDRKTLKIILANGLIINMEVYALGHSYWLSVKLDTTVMPTIEAVNFAKNNGFLYDGWFFEIPQPEGSRLFGQG